MKALALILAMIASPVAAQNCAPRDAVVARLADGYGETRQSIGIDARGSMIEVFANTKTGSFTVAMTNANGFTCLIASGQSFEILTEAPPPGGKDM